MKKTILKITLASGLIIAPFICFATTHAKKDSCTITVQVKGLVCDFCATSITKQLKKQKSIKDVIPDTDKNTGKKIDIDISIPNKTVTIPVKEGAEIIRKEVEAAVKSAVEDAGYKLSGNPEDSIKINAEHCATIK